MWYSSFVLLFKIMPRRHVEYLMNLMVLMLICDYYRVPTMAQEVMMLNSRVPMRGFTLEAVTVSLTL